MDVEVFDRVQSELRDIIEHSAATSKDSEALIGALYGSFMDETHIEALDAAPLKHDLALTAFYFWPLKPLANHWPLTVRLQLSN